MISNEREFLLTDEFPGSQKKNCVTPDLLTTSVKLTLLLSSEFVSAAKTKEQQRQTASKTGNDVTLCVNLSRLHRCVAGWLFAVCLVLQVWVAQTRIAGRAHPLRVCSCCLANGLLGVAAGKLSAGWFTIFVKGILCNLLVCLGVWVGYAGRTVADKVLGVLLPVSAFVALGFEHCVANLYFLPLSMALSASGYVAEGIDPALFTWANVAKNLTAATLGNTVAGASLAMLYRASCAKR